MYPELANVWSSWAVWAGTGMAAAGGLLMVLCTVCGHCVCDEEERKPELWARIEAYPTASDRDKAAAGADRQRAA